jgi:uncharacterized protein (TIGR02246 family)
VIVGKLAVSCVVVMLVAVAGCEARRDTASGSEQAAAPAGPAGRSAEEQEIRARSGAWDDAMLARDVDRLLTLYTPDAIIYEPGLAPITGADALRRHLDELAALAIAIMETEIREVHVAGSGELAVEVGHSRWAWDEPAGRMEKRGPYLAVWRRDDGEWRIAREIFNSDLPQAPRQPRQPQ